MHPTSPHSRYLKPEQWAVTFMRTLSSWWHMLHLVGIALVMGFSRSTYRQANRNATYRYIYTGTWQILPWFTLLAALLSLVLIRIVIVTALSYGLSRYALEMMVRVLVLELIPLSAALFVALRAGLAFNSAQLPATAQTAAVPDIMQLQQDLVPRVIASAFSVMSLATVSGLIVLLLAYINVYGITPWGLLDYTRTVGRVFEPAVTLGFALKTLLFGLAVAVVPTAAILENARCNVTLSSTLQPGATRLLFVLVLIEVGALAVKYI